MSHCVILNTYSTHIQCAIAVLSKVKGVVQPNNDVLQSFYFLLQNNSPQIRKLTVKYID